MTAIDDITEGLDKLVQSAFVGGHTKKSYEDSNPTESARVFGYLDGGPEPSPWPSSLMGIGLSLVERGRRALEAPPPPPDLVQVAIENGSFTLTENSEVAYGAGTAWVNRVLAPGVYRCDNATFGDPAVGAQKACWAKPSPDQPTPYPATKLYPSEVAP